MFLYLTSSRTQLPVGTGRLNDILTTSLRHLNVLRPRYTRQYSRAIIIFLVIWLLKIKKKSIKSDNRATDVYEYMRQNTLIFPCENNETFNEEYAMSFILMNVRSLCVQC